MGWRPTAASIESMSYKAGFVNECFIGRETDWTRYSSSSNFFNFNCIFKIFRDWSNRRYLCDVLESICGLERISGILLSVTDNCCYARNTDNGIHRAALQEFYSELSKLGNNNGCFADCHKTWVARLYLKYEVVVNNHLYAKHIEKCTQYLRCKTFNWEQNYKLHTMTYIPRTIFVLSSLLWCVQSYCVGHMLLYHHVIHVFQSTYSLLAVLVGMKKC